MWRYQCPKIKRKKVKILERTNPTKDLAMICVNMGLFLVQFFFFFILVGVVGVGEVSPIQSH